MARSSTQYVCKNCTYQTLKWIGCCPDCKSWDSFSAKQDTKKSTSLPIQHANMQTLEQVPKESTQRILSDIHEWDRVTGGGMIPGSFIILTGDPGIGKSTLLLQISFGLAQKNKVYYFSTEESVQQVALRARRLYNHNSSLYVSSESNLQSILATAEQEKPDILIIDSLQNCFLSESRSSSSSISLLREAALQLMRLAKKHAITILVSGHITKDGTMAGPKTLEHMVDAVFYLQAENQWQTRVLRSIKNRFGTVNELGFFQMESNGLIEVTDINHQLIDDMNHSPGSALISIQEGSRPLLLELQALTIESRLTIPQRVISGVDHKQVILIAAILEKYLKVRLSSHDIFFKISGGLKIKGHASDLGIALALLSSYLQEPIPNKSIVLGEISVTGYIKPINNSNILLKEAEKFGIKQIIASKQQDIPNNNCILFPLEHVYELLTLFSKSE